MSGGEQNNLAARRAWVFDLDGTLTRPQHDFPAMREALGIAPDVDILAAMAKFPPERYEAATRWLDSFEKDLATRSQPAEGAQQLVETLAAKGCKLGILTRNTRANARLTLKAIGLDSYFQPAHVIGRYETAPKPSPAGILALLADWTLAVSQAVMLGDHAQDIRAGMAAGCSTVLIRSATAGPVPSDWPRADYVSRSLCDVQLLIAPAADG